VLAAFHAASSVLKFCLFTVAIIFFLSFDVIKISLLFVGFCVVVNFIVSFFVDTNIQTFYNTMQVFCKKVFKKENPSISARVMSKVKTMNQKESTTTNILICKFTF